MVFIPLFSIVRVNICPNVSGAIKPNWREVMATLVEGVRLSAASGKAFCVPVDGECSWGQLVAAGNYDLVMMPEFEPAKNLPALPMEETGDRNVYLVLLAPTKTGDFPPKAKGLLPQQWLACGKRLVHPRTLLNWAARHPEEQLECPIFTVWQDAANKVWLAMLGGMRGKRTLVVFNIHPRSIVHDSRELEEYGGSSRAAIYDCQ